MEENTNSAVTNQEVSNPTQESNTAEEKTYTEKEFQSEIDRRVNLLQQKMKKDYDRQLSLSQLDAEAREKAEKDDRIAELEGKLKEFNMLQAKNDAIQTLTARGLNAKFADYLNIGEDTVIAQKLIEDFDKLFKAEVAAATKKQLNSSVPAIGGDANIGEHSVEWFKKLNMEQRTKLYQSDAEEYKRLSALAKKS